MIYECKQLNLKTNDLLDMAYTMTRTMSIEEYKDIFNENYGFAEIFGNCYKWGDILEKLDNNFLMQLYKNYMKDELDFIYDELLNAVQKHQDSKSAISKQFVCGRDIIIRDNENSKVDEHTLATFVFLPKHLTYMLELLENGVLDYSDDDGYNEFIKVATMGKDIGLQDVYSIMTIGDYNKLITLYNELTNSDEQGIIILK